MDRVLLPLLLAACQDYGLNTRTDPPAAVPRIELSDERVDFGEVDLGDTTTRVITASNVGDATLTLDAMDFSVGSSWTWSFLEPGPALPWSLAPGGWVDVALTYTRATDTDQDVLRVHSNDPGNPVAEVDLLGGITYGALAWDPPEWDFGAVELGSTATTTLQLHSVGTGAARLDRLALQGEHFVIVAGPALPLRLEPGGWTPVTVGFTPVDPSVTYGADLVAEGSTSPVAPLAGTGSGVPVAVCTVDPPEVAANSGTATFDGSASYDSTGRPITRWSWRWASTPDGSAVELPGDGVSVAVVPDLAGTYEAELTVENDLGQVSEGCHVLVDAVPAEDLWIEMFWSEPGDDMDLHLLAPGGILETESDCYYLNCTGRGLDWGTPADRTDDPSLDLDDIPGTGPENINIAAPETGVFTVLVNDYPSTIYKPGNEVTVNVYVAGVLAWTDTRKLVGEDSYEYFCEVDWPSGVVTAL